MHDVAMRSRLAALVIAAAVALLVVSGAMLFGMGNPAQAQSNPEPPCTTIYCLDKTASSSIGSNTVEVGEPITFTITERCGSPTGCISSQNIVDTLPSGLTDVSYPAGCTLSENTLTCGGLRSFTPTQPHTLTIVATPTECGSFTNSVSKPTAPTATATFTVVRCPPPTKEECKKGGWEEFGFPDQGSCVSAWNRENRP
jgi:hypothetical protein